MKHRIYLAGVFLLAFASTGLSQTNSWNSLLTGNWHDLSWSLGVRPQSNHWVNVTNSGSKAVIVNGATRDTYRPSMTISNLVLSAPLSATNTLLLNFLGTGVPFNIQENCTVGTNGVLLNLFSALSIGKSNATLMIAGGSAKQEGGSNIINGHCQVGYDHSSGHYILSNGVFTANSLEISSDGSAFFQQSGGQTLADEILVGRSYRPGSFNVANGVAQINRINVENGDFSQVNSTVVSSNSVVLAASDHSYSCNYGIAGTGSLTTPLINVTGYDDGYGPYTVSHFDINGGAVTTDTISAYNLGIISQTAGTLTVRGNVNGGISQSGGWLMTSNTYLYNPHHFVLSVSYNQTGGTNITTNSFEVGRDAQFFLQGGRLDVKDLVIARGQFIHSGGSLTNRGKLIFRGGSLVLGLAQNFFGPLMLQETVPFSFISSGLSLPTNNCVVRFARSIDVPWSSTDVLKIYGWKGATNGGGAHQLFVGTNGLSTTQLEQVIFIDPLGLSSGEYNGKILGSGELVPTTAFRIAARPTPSGLVLFWAGARQLQSSTNVAGPYSLVPNSYSPYSPSVTEPKRFFRLAQ